FQAFVDADNDSGTNQNPNHTTNYNGDWYGGPNIHGSPVAWDVRTRGSNPYIFVYGWSEKDTLKRFTFDPAAGIFRDAVDATPANPSPGPHGSVSSPNKSMPGGMLSISANGTSNGIVWAVVEEPFPNTYLRHGSCSGSQKGQPPVEC